MEGEEGDEAPDNEVEASEGQTDDTREAEVSKESEGDNNNGDGATKSYHS